MQAVREWRALQRRAGLRVLASDPSGTSGVARQYMADFKRRWKTLNSLIWETIVTNDALRIGDPRARGIVAAQAATRFDFPSDPAGKAAAFNAWFRDEFGKEVLGPQGWQDVYVRGAYGKGAQFAERELLKAGVPYDAGTLQQVFNRPVHAEAVGLLFTRNFEELRGIGEATSQAIGRTLANGLVEGLGPREMARQIQANTLTIGRNRSLLLARTEIIRSHAEATLNTYEEAGLEEVGVLAEFLSAQDDRVCPDCVALEGTVFPLAEARGTIPVHPNCRCVWLPTGEGITRGGAPQRAPRRPAPTATPRFNPRTATPEEVVARLRAVADDPAFTARAEARAAELARLSQQSNEIYSEMNTLAFAQRDAVMQARFEFLKDEYDRLSILQRQAAAAGSAKPTITDAVRVPKNRRSKVAPSFTAKTKDFPAATRGFEAFEELVDKRWTEGVDMTVRARSAGNRAYFNPELPDAIFVGQSDDAAVVVHEMMHWLEDKNDEILRAMIAWRDARIAQAGTPTETLSKLTGLNYGAEEVANPDGFFSPYVGKLYQRGGRDWADEVLSMGMQRMIEDPLDFWDKDPDHFALILRFIQGRDLAP